MKKIVVTVLLVPCLTTYQSKKYIENCKSVGAGAHKVGKVCPNVDPNFPDIWS